MNELHRRRERGWSLAEITIVMAIIGVASAMAVPRTADWSASQRLSSSVINAEGALDYARARAIQTGNLHLVFFGTDANGAPLFDAGGQPADILVVDDGRVGDLDQNCDIDAGEAVRAFLLQDGVSQDALVAGAKVPVDPGRAVLTNGTTLRDAGGNAASWVMFRSEGTSVAFSNDCSIGAIGSGGGGIYLSNGDRDVAVVVTALGSSRVHSYEKVSGNWTL